MRKIMVDRQNLAAMRQTQHVRFTPDDTMGSPSHRNPRPITRNRNWTGLLKPDPRHRAARNPRMLSKPAAIFLSALGALGGVWLVLFLLHSSTLH